LEKSARWWPAEISPEIRALGAHRSLRARFWGALPRGRDRHRQLTGRVSACPLRHTREGAPRVGAGARWGPCDTDGNWLEIGSHWGAIELTGSCEIQY